jgi:hypothetical protein
VHGLKDIVDVTQKLFTILGVLVGGAWAYFKFFKNRTYRPRLDIDLTGQVMQQGADHLLLVTISVRNVGLTNVSIRQEGTGLMVSVNQPLPADRSAFEEISWNEDDAVVFEILIHHAWIEPNETISEDVMVALPNQGEIGLRLLCRIVPNNKPRSVEWNAMRIISARSGSVVDAKAVVGGRS